MPVEQHLRTTYRSDRDYVDGVLVARNAGERDHGELQGLITAYLISRRKQWGIVMLPEQRVQVKTHRERTPDVCILRESDPREPIVRTPPLVCIEILSREDSMLDMQDRIDDYVAFGVPCVWVLNPRSRKAYICTPGQMIEAADGVLRAAGTDIAVPLAELFEP